MIEFKCPGCGHLFQVDDAHAGRRGACSGCKSLFTVPLPPQPMIEKDWQTEPPNNRNANEPDEPELTRWLFPPKKSKSHYNWVSNALGLVGVLILAVSKWEPLPVVCATIILVYAFILNIVHQNRRKPTGRTRARDSEE